MLPRILYYNLKQLKEKGWTQSKITSWLGEPDEIIKNPMYKRAAPSKLYLTYRVHEIEASDEFKEWLEKTRERRNKLSKSLKDVNTRKREELIKYIDSLEIEIEKMELDKLRELAVIHYNNLWASRGRDEKTVSINDDITFLNRICVNMLRHSFTDYEREIERMFGKVGKAEGYKLLKEKINNKIFEVYPDLRYW